MSCRKKILFIFAGLLVLSLLFVPYYLKSVTYRKDAYSRTIIRRTFYESGFMFLPKYLIESRKKYPAPTAGAKYYALNKNLLIMEIALIFFLGGLDYFIFCLFLSKRKGEKSS
jgi:hypothetical protein